MHIKKFTLITFLLFCLTLVFQIPQQSLAQDSIKQHRVLVVDNSNARVQNSPFPNMPSVPGPPKIFKKGKRVTITKNSSNEKIRGRIECLGDSSIIINGQTINLSDVSSIKAYRGVETAIVGGSAFVASFSLFGIFTGTYVPDYNDEGEDQNRYSLFNKQIVTIVVGFASGVVALVGIISLASSKRYRMEDGYQLKIEYEKPPLTSPPMPGNPFKKTP